MNMGFSVETESKEGYFQVSFSGDYNLLGALEGLDHLLKICGEMKAMKVLVDVRSLTGAIPSMDRFQFGEAFAVKFFEKKRAGQISHVRFAFLGRHPIIDPNKFGETVAVNWGMTLKVTTDLKEALDWLLVESPSE